MPSSTKTTAASEPHREPAALQREATGFVRGSRACDRPVAFAPRFDLDPGRVSVRAHPPAPLAARIHGSFDRDDVTPSDPSTIAEQGFVGAAREVPYRREMEVLFGQDFGAVESYSGAAASRANHALRSHAYTIGHRIGFATPSPSRATVAHELTHVLQHAGSPNGGPGIDAAGEAEATSSEQAVLRGRAPRLSQQPRGLVHAATQRHGGPALKPLTPIAGASPTGPTGVRASAVGGPLGETGSLEFQLWGWAGARFPLGPLLNFQFVPEIRLLNGVRNNGAETTTQTTLSGRLIFVLTGGVLAVAEAFGSGTTFADGVIATTTRDAAAGPAPDGSTESVTGYVLLRCTLRYGVRALRSLLEWSMDSPTFQIARIEYKANRIGDRWVAQEPSPKFEWGPELRDLGRTIASKVEEAREYLPDRLIAAGWRSITELAQLTIATTRAAAEVGAAVVAAPARLYAGALLNVRDRLNPANWDATKTPPFAIRVGQSVWQKIGSLTVEPFFQAVRGTLATFGISREVARMIAIELNSAEPPAGSYAYEYTADSVLRLTPLDFVRILGELRLIHFTRDLDSFTLPSLYSEPAAAGADPQSRARPTG